MISEIWVNLSRGTGHLVVRRRTGDIMKNLLAGAAALILSTLPALSASVIVGSGDGTIGTLDTDTGVVTGAYDAGPAWFDIAVDDGGAVYGTDGSTLYSIDVGTSSDGVAIGGHSFVNGLAFDDAGTLYGAGGGTLYTLDLITGASTMVGSIGSSYSSSGDIAFSSTGVLFGTSSSGCVGTGDCLFTIDTTTGIGTYVGDIGYSSVFGLARVGGTLFGMTAANQLLTIDTATGAGTLQTSYALSGGTFGAAVPPSAVPLPGAVWLMLGGAGLLGALRRRQRAA